MQPGTQLGHYEILSLLGKGGMGDVWKAWDTRLSREVALKTLPAEFAEDADRLSRFEREARLLASLSHPNIVTIYSVEEAAGVHFLTMELIDGLSLADILTDEGLDTDRLLDIALPLIEALGAAHAKGITHRDLKPQNIMITGQERPKVLDFGLAKLTQRGESQIFSRMTTESQTQAGLIMGTVPYMSPEQIQGQRVDHRSDIFSLGILLFEMATGRRPFTGGSSIELFSSILKDPAPPASELRPSCPKSVSRIIERCLAKSPDARYQDAQELYREMSRLSSTREAAEQPPSIAVLPFADLSAARDHDWFSDGLTEEIINSLTRISGLKVIARTSAFAFRGRQEDVRAIARELGVTNVLEGSVRTAGNRIRVTAQLVAATDGSHLWSERYDRELTDIFAIQDDIAQAIASALKVKLSPEARDPRRHTPNLEAYGALLKARHNVSILTPQSLLRSKELFEQAIDLDPEFALPRVELGWSLVMHATENLMPAREAAARMKDEGRRALQIEPSLADAHVVPALAAVLDYDWQEAGKHFELTRARDAIPPFVRYYYAVFYLAALGRMKEAEAEVAQALEEDPLNFLFRVTVGILRIGDGREEAGEWALREVLELNENIWIALHWLCTVHVRRGELSEALGYAQRAFLLVPKNTASVGLFAGLLARSGETKRADELLEQLGSGEAFGAPAGLAAYHAVRSEPDLAAGWFEKAIVQRDTRAPWILRHLFGTLVTSSSRWPALVRMMNLRVPSPQHP